MILIDRVVDEITLPPVFLLEMVKGHIVGIELNIIDAMNPQSGINASTNTIIYPCGDNIHDLFKCTMGINSC